MRAFFTPKTLALTGLALALAFWPGRACAQQSGSATASPAKAVQVDSVSFKPISDPYNQRYGWMQVRVDLTAKFNPNTQALNPKWVPDVNVMATLGWGSKSGKSGAPQIDVAVTATAKLVALEVNTRSTVMFYLPPEFLQSATKSPSGINASMPPDFFVVQVQAGGTTMDPTAKSVSSSSLPDKSYVDGFVRAAGDLASKNSGMMLPANEVPYYIYRVGLDGASGTVVPTFKSSASNTP